MHPVALLAWSAIVIGHGLSNGVLSSGLLSDVWLTRLLFVGALLSQLTALLVPALLLRQTFGGFLLEKQSRISGWLSLPLAAGWSWLTLLSAADLTSSIRSEWLLVLSAGMLTLAAEGCIRSVRDRATRAASLVGLACCAAGGARIASQWLANIASRTVSADLMEYARLASSLGWMSALIGMGLALWWLWGSSGVFTRAVIALLMICAPALVWTGSNAEGWKVAVQRTLDQLSAQPHPQIPEWTRQWHTATTVLLTLCIGAQLRVPQSVPIALFLLAILRLDVPIYNALALLAVTELVRFSQTNRFGATSEDANRFS